MSENEKSSFDVVGRLLSDVIEEFTVKGVQYSVVMTKPVRETMPLDSTVMFVLRQRLDEDNCYHLVAAAKMGKEVSI